MYSGEIIAGGEPGDFALVRHVRLGGSQRDIGRHIAEFAWSNHGVRPQPGPDPAVTRARRAWRAIHWPELEERAAGVADRWDLAPGDGGYETGSLFVSGVAGGCSVVWLPPERTTTGAPPSGFVNPDIPVRTLWHVLYEPAAAAMTVSFHVRDGQSGEVRSPQMRFSLAPGGPAEPEPPLASSRSPARHRHLR